MNPKITLRKMAPDDVLLCFEHQLDPEASRMAAFMSKDTKDRAAYGERWKKVLEGGTVTARMILSAADTVGMIASWDSPEGRQVTYWVWKEHWGKGIATAALQEFLTIERTRPLLGCAASDNHGSIRVLEKCGFRPIRRQRSYASARGEEIEEAVLRLD